MLISNFFYILAAILPAIIILLYVFKQDAFPEPKEIVIKTFIFGAAITIALDLFIGDFDRFSEKNLTGETYFFFDSFIRAAFLEEIFKMMIIVFYCTRKTAFDEPMDGLVYGVAASLGYAAWENIDYVLFYINESGKIVYDPSFYAAIVRAFSAVPLHALCGVMMGFLISQTLFEKKYNFYNLILALAVPVGIHGLWNYSISSEIISEQIAYITAFIFFFRSIYIFRNFKRNQLNKTMFSVKYYNITAKDFSFASIIVLSFYLILNFLISL
jgi:RsiW-degrading membrane proteinase PrsW (M82 family)